MDDLAEAMDGIETVHLTATLYSTFDRLCVRGRPPAHPLAARVVDLARRAGVSRLIVLSSAAVYGFSRDGRISERIRPLPEHPYELLLARNEEWLRQQSPPDVVVLRAAQLFGPGEPLLTYLVNRLVARRPVLLPGGGRARRTFLAGPDLGRAFLAASLRGEPGAAYLVGGARSSWRELVEAAARALSVTPQLRRLPYDLAYLATSARLGRGSWPTTYLVDLLSRPQVVEDGWSRRELCWKPEVTTVAAGLVGLADWYREASAAAPAGASVISSPHSVGRPRSSAGEVR